MTPVQVVKPRPIRTPGHYTPSPFESFTNITSKKTYDSYKEFLKQNEEEMNIQPDPITTLAPKLTIEGYSTIPDIDDLLQYTEEELASVENFVIERDGYGSILFPGLTNLIGLDLNKIVEIRQREVILYPTEEERPPEGEGLNKEAIITLFNCFPVYKDKIIKNNKKILSKFEDKLKAKVENFKGKFIDYDQEQGVWRFIINTESTHENIVVS